MKFDYKKYQAYAAAIVIFVIATVIYFKPIFSGKELRQDIKVKKDELMEEAEKHIADAKVKAKELINEMKSEKLT